MRSKAYLQKEDSASTVQTIKDAKLDSSLNFDQHIKESISPVMKELEFKKKNLVFTRSNGRYEEIVVLQKSMANYSCFEKTIFVNYHIAPAEEKKRYITFNRLKNKMKNQFYDRLCFFDEDDLVKMLAFLGSLLKEYTNLFFSKMEEYLDQFETLNTETCSSNKIIENCNRIFDDLQKNIPENEILFFNLERETFLPPALKLLTYQEVLYEKSNIDSFDAEILNLGKPLKGLKVIFKGNAITDANIEIKKICCLSAEKVLLFEKKDYTEIKYENGKILAFDFHDLVMKPYYDKEKLEKLSSTDKFANQRAEKYSRLDSIKFKIYFDIKKPVGTLQFISALKKTSKKDKQALQ